jgi:hypothetical protein
LKRDLKPIAAESCVDLDPFLVPESLYHGLWMPNPTKLTCFQTASTSALLSWSSEWS